VLSTPLKTYFEPEVLMALQAVFDDAWQEINAGRALTAQESDHRRTDLAQKIIFAHRSGIPPEQIKDSVLGRHVAGAPGARSLPRG
jgi:hypothetical protein